MTQKTKSKLSLLFVFAILLVFVLLKLPALHLPYFWDELGVYARAGLYMHDNGIGLMPDKLPPELSRGHPLLFSWIHALGFTIFGDTVVGGHITALLISIALLLSLYYIVSKHYSFQTALLTLMLLCVQPLFFAQSVLILPEITLALFMLWSIHFWVMKKYLLHGVFATLAILTKETAIILPFVILFSELFLFLWKGNSERNTKYNIKYLWSLLPILIFGIFLLIQKSQNGWYLFPLHEENVIISINRIITFGIDYIKFLFLEQGRILITVLSILIIIYILYMKNYKLQTMTVFLCFLIAEGLAFNALNFYMNRYLVFVLIPFIILSSSLLVYAINKYKVVILVIPILFMGCIYTMFGRALFTDPDPQLNLQQRFKYDEDMSYTLYLATQQEAVNWVLDAAVPSDKLYANFPLVLSFIDPRLGFTNKKTGVDFFIQPQQEYQTGFQFALIADPGSYNHRLPSNDSLLLVKNIRNEVLNINIFTPQFP